jgi:hypothetical protein
MTLRTIQVVVRRTVTYERKVTVQVEETAERLKDEKDPRYGASIAFNWTAMDAAKDKAKCNSLTGWKPVGQRGIRSRVGTGRAGGEDGRCDNFREVRSRV